MKEKAIIFIVGLLLGAIIATGAIYVYTLANNNSNNNIQNNQMNGGMPNGERPEMPNGNGPQNNSQTNS